MRRFTKKEVLDAVYNEYLGKLKSAYKTGFDMSFANRSLLMEAIRLRKPRVVELLVTQCKIDPNGDPLIEACKDGFLDTVYVLCKRGANVNIADGQPLIEAVKHKHYSVAEALVMKFGAEPTMQFNLAAYIAIAQNHYALAELCLIKAGKRSCSVNFDMYGIACANADAKMFELLEKRYTQQSRGTLIRNVEKIDGKEVKVWNILLEHAISNERFDVAVTILNKKPSEYAHLSYEELRELVKVCDRKTMLYKDLLKELNIKCVEASTCQNAGLFV